MYSTSEKNILLIVEGAKREPQLLKRMFDAFGLLDDYQIVSVAINVHDFLNKLYQEYGCDFDGVALVDFVADSVSGRRERARLLETSFTDILLVFDLDPQDNRHDFKRLKEMQDFYCDSTDMGQLFLSYPSVEAYRDFDSFDYASLSDAIVPADVISGNISYKKWVSRRGDLLADIGRIDSYTFACVVAVHAMRALAISKNQGSGFNVSRVDNLASLAMNVDHTALLCEEIKSLDGDSLYACCTCLFFISNWPKRLNDVWNKTNMRGLGIRLF